MLKFEQFNVIHRVFLLVPIVCPFLVVSFFTDVVSFFTDVAVCLRKLCFMFGISYKVPMIEGSGSNDLLYTFQCHPLQAPTQNVWICQMEHLCTMLHGLVTMQ